MTTLKSEEPDKHAVVSVPDDRLLKTLTDVGLDAIMEHGKVAVRSLRFDGLPEAA